VSEDEERRAQDEIQKLTDRHIADIDKMIAAKETELMAVDGKPRNVNPMKPFASSTRRSPLPATSQAYRIIMDATALAKNAISRASPVTSRGRTVRRVTRACTDRGIGYLTLFASARRTGAARREVSTLKQLFMAALEQEAARLHENRVRLKISAIWCLRGARGRARAPARSLPRKTWAYPHDCANYGGRWDLIRLC